MIWNKPSNTGREIDYLSLFQINNSKKPLINCSGTYTDNTINKLINRGIDCPLIDRRKTTIEVYKADHVYFSTNEPELVDASVACDTAVLINVVQNAGDSRILNELQIVTPRLSCCKNTYEKIYYCDVFKIAKDTKNNKTLWHKERQFRITGSRCYSVFTYSKNDWANKALKYFWPKGFVTK